MQKVVQLSHSSTQVDLFKSRMDVNTLKGRLVCCLCENYIALTLINYKLNEIKIKTAALRCRLKAVFHWYVTDLRLLLSFTNDPLLFQLFDHAFKVVLIKLYI